jgi:prolyl oligopeptidase
MLPETRRDDLTETRFGVTFADPYRWLEDMSSPEAQEWTHAQDEATRAYLNTLPDKAGIAARLKELLYIPAIGLPERRDGRFFYSRRDPAKEKAFYCVSEGEIGAAGNERVLLDPNEWNADGSVALGVCIPSWDGKKVVYGKKPNNSDEATLEVLDVDSGEVSAVDVIPGGKYASPDWTPASDGFYYAYLPSVDASGAPLDVAVRPGFVEIRFHRLGSDPAKDPVVHERTGDPRTFLRSHLSDDGRWLLVTIEHGWTRNETFARDLHAGADAPFFPVTGPGPGSERDGEQKDAQYDVTPHGDHFYIWTNEDAPNGRLFVTPAAQTPRSAWKEIVAERADASMTFAQLVGGRLAIGYLKDVVAHLEIHALDGALEREVTLPTVGSISGLSGRADEGHAFFSFTSFTHPTELFELTLSTGATRSLFQLSTPVDAARFAVTQELATSKDGTKVPVFILHDRALVRDGNAPTILYGYGGFQVAQTPAFQASLFAWLERGGVYALACLRGGSEYGEAWHRAGMRDKKQNVFDDVTAIAEQLIAHRWTSASKLAIRGGSNGGLLVGAAITQRPDLYAVALCGVPLLDMLRYDQFGSGKTWIDEYGTAEKEADFKVLHAYSPYHHVKDGTRYPAMLMLSADTDDRVDPMHARKFVALLQHARSQHAERGVEGAPPVYLRVEKNAGHGGGDMMKSAIERVADEYAFVLSNVR